MRCIVLIENTPGAEGCIYEHGLSIYVEAVGKKILLDTGATNAFLKNAQSLGIELSKVDMVILSHGHYDHAGGIMDFVKLNSHAKIYMRPGAVQEYYHLYEADAKYIGVDKRILELPQVIYTKEYEALAEGISLFSGVQGRRLWPGGNKSLKRLKNNVYEQDDFEHEQSLVFEEQGVSVLLSGCAHNGILNILDKYREIYGRMPDKVITGFHMKKNVPLTEEEKKIVQATAEELKQMKDTLFYSGHCTGAEAFDIMKEIMGAQLRALHSGMCIE